jgi:hypothetical protein
MSQHSRNNPELYAGLRIAQIRYDNQEDPSMADEDPPEADPDYDPSEYDQPYDEEND